jgi:dephospho-CoA kinase
VGGGPDSPANMKLFGITGGVGMGKSTTGALLEKRGVAVIDTDHLARQLVEPGRPALAEISAAFGPALIRPDGGLDRAALARRVFADPAERARLEAILHPRIREAWQAEAAQWRAAGREEGAVIIPLLYETRAETLFDTIVCVACGAGTQQERLRERGWSRAEIRQRIEAQWPAEEKMARADFVVWTDTAMAAHAAQLDKILLTCAAPGLAPISSGASGGPA